jgi:alkylation response protein AidB-like acyl-CoA dehydrogenase
VQYPIARAYAQTEAADLMVRKAAALYEAILPCGAEANMAKMLGLGGGVGRRRHVRADPWRLRLRRGVDIERKFRETRLYMVAPISTNMILNFILRARAGAASALYWRGGTRSTRQLATLNKTRRTTVGRFML